MRRQHRSPGHRCIPGLAWVVLLCLGLTVVTGCAGLKRTESARLAHHPIHDTRMSDHAEKDYVLTGVWRVRGVSNTVYLIGTSHVVGDDAIPFPSSFYAAYADSQMVYVEFDTNLSWRTQLRLMPKLLKWVKAHREDIVAPRGQTLSNYLSPETLGQLRQRYGKDFSRDHITPILLLLLNEAGALEARAGGKPSGVEEPFEKLARRDGKPRRQLDEDDIIETVLPVLDQVLLGYKRDIARRGADAVVREALLEGQRDDDAIWRHGDLAAVTQLQEEMKKESPALYDQVLRERNRKWMPKLEALLHSRKNALVLVGLAHLPGEDGLLHLLGVAGFSAEQMYGVERPGKP